MCEPMNPAPPITAMRRLVRSMVSPRSARDRRSGLVEDPLSLRPHEAARHGWEVCVRALRSDIEDRKVERPLDEIDRVAVCGMVHADVDAIRSRNQHRVDI